MKGFYYKTVGRKYELIGDYVHVLDFDVPDFSTNQWATLIPRCMMVQKRGYKWDGASYCPRFMDKWLLRASCVHDGLTQLIKQGLLPQGFRILADRELKRIAIEDGMNRIVAEIAYKAVRAYALLK